MLQENNMKDLIRLTDLSRDDIQEIFETADHLCIEKSNLLGGKSIVLFFLRGWFI